MTVKYQLKILQGSLFLWAEPIEHLKDLLTHNFSICSYDAFYRPSSVTLHAQWLIHISLHIDAFQTHFLADLNVHNNVCQVQIPICFHVSSVLCNMQPVWFWKSLATLRANKFHYKSLHPRI